MSVSDFETEPRRSIHRRSTTKEQARNTEFKRPEFFDEEYEPLDRCTKTIQRKIKHREIITDKGFVFAIIIDLVRLNSLSSVFCSQNKRKI